MSDSSYIPPILPLNDSKVCRICGIEKKNGHKLFNFDNEIQTIAVQICSHISIKLERSLQMYPNWICFDCQSQLQATYHFFELVRNGQKKIHEQFGNPPKVGRKPKRPKESLIKEDAYQTDGADCDNIRDNGKRIPKTPKRFKDSMQGDELEELYSKIGVTKPKTRQSDIEKSEIKESTRYDCDFCDERFVTEFAFYNHLSYHTNILYQCIECQAVFKVKSMFDEHQMFAKHTGLCIIETPPPTTGTDEAQKRNEIKQFACSKCPKSFNSNAAIQRHEKTHSNLRPYECKICLASFKKKFVLKVHESTHSKKRKFKCHLCPKRFNYNRCLQVHLQGIHAGLKPYSCSICKKSFSQQSNLKIHNRIHTGDRPFVCLKCGASFKTSSQCRLHQKTHAKPEVLKIQNYNADISKNPLVCKICGKHFNQASNLRKHFRIHTGEKPYGCNFCPKKFADISNLKKHKNNHFKQKTQNSKPISLLKKDLCNNTPNSDPNQVPESNLHKLIIPTKSSLTNLETSIEPNVNNSLIEIINENEDGNANPWDSDVFVTDIPNDQNATVQQQQQQENLMNQLVCISYQDPMNPVNSKTTFYVVN